jgi:hypothetical protein
MKHLRKFFESVDITKEEILENFLYITDRFGEPEVSTSKYGKSKKWTISWNIKLDLSVMQEAEQLISKLKDLTEDIDDVLAAADRLEDFTINMSLSNYLKLELVPKDTGEDTYKFISHYDWRQLYIRINEIERFFNARGIRIEKWDNESMYRENDDNNELWIYLSKVDREANGTFCDLVNAELQEIDDREYRCSYSGNQIFISPEEEKAFVEVSNN